MIVFPCPCGKRLRAPDRAAGRSLPCPSCHRRLTVPSPRHPRHLWPWLAGAGGLLMLAAVTLLAVLLSRRTNTPSPRADKGRTSEPSQMVAKAPAPVTTHREPEKRPTAPAPVRPDPKPEKARPPAPRSEPASKPPPAIVPVTAPAVSPLPTPGQSPGIASSSPSTSPLPAAHPPAAPVPAGLEQPRRLKRLVIWKQEGLGDETQTYLTGTAFSSDRRTLAAAYSLYGMKSGPSIGQDAHRAMAKPNHVTLWDLAAGAELRRLQPASAIDLPRGPAFSSDGTRLLTVSGRHLGRNGANGFEASLRLWDTRTGKELASRPSSTVPERLPEGQVISTPIRLGCAVFSPDGRYVLSACDDADLGGIPWGSALPSAVLAVRRAVTDGYSVRVWDARLKREVRRLVGHTAPVHALAFSPDGKYLFSASGWGDPLAQPKVEAETLADNGVRQWNMATGREVRRFMAGEGFIHSLAVSPDGRRLLTGSADGHVRCWDVATGKQRPDFHYSSFEAFHLAFSPDGRLALLCGTGGQESGGSWPWPIDSVRLCDADSGAELLELGKCRGYGSGRLPRDSYSITNAALSPDGRRAFLVVYHVESATSKAAGDGRDEVVVEEWGLPAALGKAGQDGKRDPGGVGGPGGSSGSYPRTSRH